jgi:hypothetical protein
MNYAAAAKELRERARMYAKMGVEERDHDKALRFMICYELCISMACAIEVGGR